jgi:hypothetical protein
MYLPSVIVLSKTTVCFQEVSPVLPPPTFGMQWKNSTACWFVPGKFRFCLHCDYVLEAYGRDVNRLSSLSGEGRSSATTILTLSTLQQLFSMGEPPPGVPDPRKVLGFTDNRQDAALQAGRTIRSAGAGTGLLCGSKSP